MKQTSKERDYPLRRILTPEENRITFLDAASIELPGETVCFRGYSRMRPAFRSIAALLTHGNFLAVGREFRYEIK